VNNNKSSRQGGITLIRLGTVLTLLLLLPGCCTPALWRKAAREPASNPGLQLFWSPNAGDVLVQYDEDCGAGKAAQVRTYWLYAYSAVDTNVVSHPKPAFVDAGTCAGLEPIPVWTNPPSAGDFMTNHWLAMAAPDRCSFTLWQDSRNQGDYSLPVYRARPLNPFERVALTPVAVAGDTVLIGAALGASALASGVR
jgi:hypothetical protein